MLKQLFLVAVVVLVQLSRTDCFEFKITKQLINGEKLKKEDWINVEITKNDSTEKDAAVAVKLDVPLSISFSDASVFFANEAKEILQVYLKETLQGKFFSMPHKIKKTIHGTLVTINKTDKLQQISGNFPETWLPKNVSLVSAAVTDADGKIYNYYGLRNFGISIIDLLVLEEYLKDFS